MRSNTTKKAVISALMVAIIAVLSQLSLPTPIGVPITLQTFVIALCGYLLGVRWGAASVAVYIMLGLVGVPVFSGFRAGGAALLGLTGGFIFGFVPMVALCGIGRRWRTVAALSLLGLIIDYAAGIAQFMIISSTSFSNALVLITVPVFMKDAISLVLAYAAAQRIKRIIR